MKWKARLPYRPPLDWAAIIRFLAARATPGVEVVRDDSYRRTVEVDGVRGEIELRPGAGARVGGALAYEAVREGDAALGGRLALASPPGGGTALRAEIPLPSGR
jgi:hypothetical protein